MDVSKNYFYDNVEKVAPEKLSPKYPKILGIYKQSRAKSARK